MMRFMDNCRSAVTSGLMLALLCTSLSVPAESAPPTKFGRRYRQLRRRPPCQRLPHSKRKMRPIKIGFLVSLTGPAPELSKEMLNGLNLYLDEIDHH